MMTDNPLAWSMGGAKSTLERLILGRETSDEHVNPSARNGTNIAAKIKVVIDGDSVEFAIHSNTSCKAVKEFLSLVTPSRISFAQGKNKKSVRLGIDSKSIDEFNVFAKVTD